MFPNFANTKAELVCNGILPVDQLRDVIRTSPSSGVVSVLLFPASAFDPTVVLSHSFSFSLYHLPAPATYITHRIPRDVLDRIYGIRIIRPSEEDVSCVKSCHFLSLSSPSPPFFLVRSHFSF